MPLNRIQRYIFRECALALALVLGGFSIAILIVDVVEQLRTLGDRIEISMGAALFLSVLKLPMLIEQTLPFAVLIGTMIAYSRLSRRAELPVMRASGVSAWQFILPAVLLALLLGVATAGLVNPIGARSSSIFEYRRDRLLDNAGAAAEATQRDIWLRDGRETGQTVIRAERVEGDGTRFAGVKMIEEQRLYLNGEPTDEFVFRRRIDSARATLQPGFWRLEDVTEHLPDQSAVRHDVLVLETNLQRETLIDRFAPARTIGFWRLPSFIDETGQAGLNTARYRVQWHSLTSLPVFFAAMALIGSLACLRFARLGGGARFISAGAGAAVGLYFVSEVTSSLGSSEALPAFAAAWTPPLFAVFVALTILAYREDG